LTESFSLRSFLDGPGRPADALGYTELQGFLFAVVCAPDLIQPSEWLPIALGEDEEARFETMEQARAIFDQLMSLYNETNASLLDGTAALPDDCAFYDDVLANFDDDAPVARWSRGFLCGHNWLEDLWNDLLPEELKDDFVASSLVLCFFASRELAEDCMSEVGIGAGGSLEETAETMRRLSADAMHEYAAIGRAMRDAVLAAS